jgi:hypothetical protein
LPLTSVVAFLRFTGSSVVVKGTMLLFVLAKLEVAISVKMWFTSCSRYLGTCPIPTRQPRSNKVTLIKINQRTSFTCHCGHLNRASERPVLVATMVQGENGDSSFTAAQLLPTLYKLITTTRLTYLLIRASSSRNPQHH